MPKRHADTDDLQANIQNLTQEISGPNEELEVLDGEVAIATVVREAEAAENAKVMFDSKSAQVALETDSTRRQGKPLAILHFQQHSVERRIREIVNVIQSIPQERYSERFVEQTADEECLPAPAAYAAPAPVAPTPTVCAAPAPIADHMTRLCVSVTQASTP